MPGRLSQMIPRIFRLAWHRYGEPSMRVVRPLDEWLLPDGYAYDDATDTVINYYGYILSDEDLFLTADTVYIVPTQRSADLDVLIAAGVVPTGTVDVYILKDDAETVKAAHAIEIDDDWYDVLEVAHAPVGIGDSALWARVRLKRRS